MPPTAFVGVWAKIHRAKHHLLKLDRLSIVDANEQLLRYEEDSDAKTRKYYMRIDEFPALGIVAGDVIQNLRTALDHVAYALIAAGPQGVAAINTEELHKLQFPICGGDSNNHRALKARTLIKTHAKAGAVDVIDKAEPYERGAGRVLWQLSRLNNIDKHRLLIATLLQVPAVNLFQSLAPYLTNFPPEAIEGIRRQTSGLYINPADKSVLKAGDPVFTESLHLEPYKHVNLSFPIVLNEPKIAELEAAVPLLHQMIDFIGALVPKFDSFV